MPRPPSPDSASFSAGHDGAPPAADVATINGITRKGFTGHEVLDSTGLIHMNGRVEDPALGRMVSSDPFIDCDSDTQGWNRLSYVKNQGASLTDPSGFSSCDELQRTADCERETVTVTASRIRFTSVVFIGAPPARESYGDPGRAGGGPGRDGEGSDAPVTLPASDQESGPSTFMKCIDDCIQEYYQSSTWNYGLASDLSIFSLFGFLQSAINEEIEDQGQAAANRNRNTGNYDVGRRQAQLVQILRAAGAGSGVLGAFATGYVIGANAACAARCAGDSP